MIEYLADRVEWLPVARGWLNRVWSVAPAEARTTLAGRCRSTAVPLTLLAMEEGAPVGIVSLIDDVAPEPWRPVVCLAGLYVEPAWRGRGIGAALCRQAANEARRFGLAELYLYTPDKESFYHRLGWHKVVDTVVTDAAGLYVVTFMSLSLKV